jgi:hypothetical protein
LERARSLVHGHRNHERQRGEHPAQSPVPPRRSPDNQEESGLSGDVAGISGSIAIALVTFTSSANAKPGRGIGEVPGACKVGPCERLLLDRSLASWDAGGMTQSARRLIEQFDALPEEERSEVLAELARRVGLSPHDLPQDADLLAAADQLFVELDRRESTE